MPYALSDTNAELKKNELVYTTHVRLRAHEHGRRNAAVTK